MTRVALCAAAASLLLVNAAVHGSAVSASRHLPDEDEREKAELFSSRRLQDQDAEETNVVETNGGGGITDAISDFFFDDECDRTKKDVSRLTDLSGWMSQLAPDTLLADVTLPGTHHSGLYELSTTVNDNDPEYKTIQDNSYGVPTEVISSALCRFSMTQSLSISEQLQAGIRYLDLRIDLDSETSTFRAFHVLFGSSVEVLLGQIAEFVREHPREIVVVEMAELVNPAATASDKLKLQQVILETFGSALIPEPADGLPDLPTVGQLQQSGTTVLVAVQDEDVEGGSDLLWSTSVFRNTFANSADLDRMVAYNEERLDEFEADRSYGSRRLSKLSWLLTPDQAYIKDYVLTGSIHELAIEANGALEKFAADNQGKTLGNVLLLDYFETSPIFDVLGLSDKSEGEFVPESGATMNALAVTSLTLILCNALLNFY